MVNNLPANIGDAGDVGLVSGSRRSSGGGREKEVATSSSILAWKSLLDRGAYDLKYVEGCGEFPGGPVVETLLFHHRVYRFDPGLRN